MHRRREHRTGQLTAEEKARRLAEMMGNADTHERARAARQAEARAAEAEDAARGSAALLERARGGGGGGAGAGDDAATAAARAEVFARMHEGGASLQARINSRRHYAERGGG
jgi:hypothetical protein